MSSNRGLFANTSDQVQPSLTTLIGSLSLILGGHTKDNEEKQNEFLQQAQQSALHVLNTSQALPSIEVLGNCEPELDVEDRESVVKLSEEFRFSAETIVESLSVALEAIAVNPKDFRPLQETYNRVLLLLDTERELLAITHKFLLNNDDKSNYFNTIRTRITDFQLLQLTLEQLGLLVKLNAEVRGDWGRQVRADIVAVLDGNYDIGWSRNKDSTFDMITYLPGVTEPHGLKLINSINTQYFLNASSTDPGSEPNK
jgi:hypothetical protein